ncbi:MAG: GNAT family N-acetyltransferase [Actinobacteria bacterium]|nr:GNAT family N-acetyltransferase [Actinomycetota bacterium]MBO0835258.1 GNAT family N-acetyltransferase [Actinomycetota bacterium]
MRLAFRRATSADVGAIVKLVESAYRGDASRAGWTTEADLLDGQRTDTAAVGELLATPDGIVLLAEDAGQLVGCCHLERRTGGEAYFGMFSVQPTQQSNGVGGQLLTEAERLAQQEWAATTMVMTVIAQRTELISWYERRGYHRTGELRPFPYGDERFGIPRRPDLVFAVLAKPLRGAGAATAR